MEEKVNLNRYKEYLNNYYIYPCDCDSIQKRKDYIKKYYPDNFLGKVVEDTKKFVLSLVRQMVLQMPDENDKVFVKEMVSSYIYKDILNGCLGGYHADKLICPDEFRPNFLVSLYLIKTYFGENFIFDLYDDIEDEYDEAEEVGSFSCATYLYICGSKKEFLNNIYNDLDKNHKLVKKKSK